MTAARRFRRWPVWGVWRDGMLVASIRAQDKHSAIELLVAHGMLEQGDEVKLVEVSLRGRVREASNG